VNSNYLHIHWQWRDLAKSSAAAVTVALLLYLQLRHCLAQHLQEKQLTPELRCCQYLSSSAWIEHQQYWWFCFQKHLMVESCLTGMLAPLHALYFGAYLWPFGRELLGIATGATQG
jgi:hypothetical protein